MTLPEERILCPECDGKKQRWCHLNPGGWRWVKCLFCDGLGTVNLATCTAWEDGRKMAADRKARGLTLREEASRLGIPPSELSDREWGRTPR